MPYYPQNAYYEGSPELGYVSKDQIVEFAEAQEQLAEEGQLFTTRDPNKAVQFGGRVFNRICRECGLYRGDSARGASEPITRYRGGDEVIAGTTFEVAINDPELGLLVNLDYLDKLVNGNGWTEYDKADISGKTGNLIRSYIADRKNFMGITESMYAQQ